MFIFNTRKRFKESSQKNSFPRARRLNKMPYDKG